MRGLQRLAQGTYGSAETGYGAEEHTVGTKASGIGQEPVTFTMMDIGKLMEMDGSGGRGIGNQEFIEK